VLGNRKSDWLLPHEVVTCDSAYHTWSNSFVDDLSLIEDIRLPRAALSYPKDPLELQMPNFSPPEKPQIFFHVREMNDTQSANAVMGVLRRLDDRATVRIDLPMRRVEIEPISAEPAAFRDAISGLGYSTVRQWPADCAYL
jgi:hypothetical protein